MWILANELNLDGSGISVKILGYMHYNKFFTMTSSLRIGLFVIAILIISLSTFYFLFDQYENIFLNNDDSISDFYSYKFNESKNSQLIIILKFENVIN